MTTHAYCPGDMGGDLAMYESLLSAALHRCGKNVQRLRLTLLPFEDQLKAAKGETERAGLALVVNGLRKRIDEVQPDLPLLGG